VVSLSDREVNLQIIEACRHGDREAFRALYESYKDHVYSITYYFFRGDAAAAADATQQVFLKLFTQIGKYRGDAEFSTWLYRLVVNVCIDGSRGSWFRAKRVNADLLENLAGRQSHEWDVVRAQDAASVRAAIASLPPKLRLPILLRYFDDLSYEELAAALNCSIGAVSSRLSRAHELLAKKLAWLKD
jgi:RNA polymerase sigma-70 factor (ECF subfamily)